VPDLGIALPATPLSAARGGGTSTSTNRRYAMLGPRRVDALVAAALNAGSHDSRSARRVPAMLVALLLCLGALAGFSPLAHASGGPSITWGPGASVNVTWWYTAKKTSTTETLYVEGHGQTGSAVNSCNYGMSVWYNDAAGRRRNIYQARNGCTFGPQWWYTTPYFTAKRGTTVQVTYRWDGTWYPGHTFRIK
jgi:hypothetical protein